MIRCTPIEYCETENVFFRHVWFHERTMITITDESKDDLEIVDEMNNPKTEIRVIKEQSKKSFKERYNVR